MGLVDRDFDIQTGFLAQFLFKERATVDDCRLQNAGVVTRVKLIIGDIHDEAWRNPEFGQDISPGQNNFRGIDSERTKHRTPSTGGTLVEIADPRFERFRIKLPRAAKTAEHPAGPGEISAEYGSQETGPRNGNVMEIIRSQVAVAGSGAGPAPGAGFQHHRKRPGEYPEFIQ
jgi:hypothetical protein